VTLTAPPTLGAAIGRGWYSPAYGVRRPCLTLDLQADVQFDGRREYRFRVAH
jgi:hypothetical protein